MEEKIEKITKFFDKCNTTEFETNTTAKGLYTIQQTKRNHLKTEFMDILIDMLNQFKEDYNQDFNVDMTRDGIVISMFNKPLDQEICFMINPSIPALANNGIAYDIYYEAEEYQRAIAEKQKQKEEKAKQKQAKAKRDAELREKWKAEKLAKQK